MMRQFKTTLHDPNLDRPVSQIYNAIDRFPWGARYELSQGESGKFYATGEIELAISELARYGKDTYDYNTFTTPIQVTVYPTQD